MDEYRSINVYELVSRDLPLSEGLPFMGSLWAYAIKYDAEGKFIKLNPRWCIMGGSMPRDKYEAYSNVVRFSVIKVLICIRVTYRSKSGTKLIDFHFDCSNAFQATRTDVKSEKLTPLYCEQAAGFKQRDSRGNAYVCKVLVAHQGRIDSARLYLDKRFTNS